MLGNYIYLVRVRTHARTHTENLKKRKGGGGAVYHEYSLTHHYLLNSSHFPTCLRNKRQFYTHTHTHTKTLIHNCIPRLFSYVKQEFSH